jgi:hypothetical protein
MEPRELVEHLEREAQLPSGSEERFNGYGIMGLPFTSGHVLALRRFPASSVGPGYSSVWHRRPSGEWSFYADVEAGQACARFFGREVAEALVDQINISWTGHRSFRVVVGNARLDWEVRVRPTVGTRSMNGVGRLLPARAWRNNLVLSAMGSVAGKVLGVGKVRLKGEAPNGQRFVTNPRRLWKVEENRATIGGEELGPMGPLAVQAHLGEFWIPQEGIFALGQAYFEVFDPERHSSLTSRP